MTERVLLTGITGYIGQHCGAELLNQGYEVVGTMRSQAKAGTTRSAIAGVAPVDKLSFVETDLLSDHGWDEAMRGCTYVMHVASPYVLVNPKNEDELIAPAVEGTLRVIAAAQRAGVKRVVLTSSIMSMVAGKASGLYGPDTWTDPTADINVYSKSKTLAERAAWEAVEHSEMELSVINPGAVFGPTLGAKIDGESVDMMSDMISGKMPMIPDIGLGMVDVRDVARLHVKALTAEGAAGKRFIAATAQPIEMTTLAGILKNTGYTKVPSLKAPSLVVKLMALFDPEAKAILPLLGKKAAFDNSATFDVLGWEPTPMETSFKEMAAAMSS